VSAADASTEPLRGLAILAAILCLIALPVDKSVAIAERLGGTESEFAALMTEKARALGMRDTFYRNATGLPDAAQVTTAADTLLLARHLADDFPQYSRISRQRVSIFRGETCATRDSLIGSYPGANGIKTGYIEASGFNLASSAARADSRLLGVVRGGHTAQSRDCEMMRLLDYGFAQVAQRGSSREACPAVMRAASL